MTRVKHLLQRKSGKTEEAELLTDTFVRIHSCSYYSAVRWSQISATNNVCLLFREESISKNLALYIEFRCEVVYFLRNPSTSTSDSRDIMRYAGLSTDHIVSGISSHEIAIAIFPFFV